MKERPPEVERRIRRLRWTAGLLWLVWLVLTVSLYTLYRTKPHLVITPLAITLAVGGHALSAVWFVYLIYRIGQLAGHVSGQTSNDQ